MSASIAVTVTKFKIAELWTNAQLVTRKYSPCHFNENQCTRSFLFPRMPEVFNRIKLSAIVTREYTHTHTHKDSQTNLPARRIIQIFTYTYQKIVWKCTVDATQGRKPGWYNTQDDARRRKTPVTLSCSALRCTTWCERSFTIAHRGSAALCHNPAGCCRTPSTTFC